MMKLACPKTKFSFYLILVSDILKKSSTKVDVFASCARFPGAALDKCLSWTFFVLLRGFAKLTIYNNNSPANGLAC